MLNTQGELIDAGDQFAQRATAVLVAAVKGGDRDAYRQLYQQHVGRVYALCLRLTGERTLAEDATQEVFIQLWRKLHNYRGDSKFSTWLHAVATHVCISYLRKQKGWIRRVFNIEDTDAINHVAEASSAEVDLDAFVRRLPERARLVFVLHAIEGYRHEEIADMTGMAVGSSKAQFHRAKQLLQEWMGYEEH